MRQLSNSKKGTCCAAALVVLVSASTAFSAPGPIVISQLFGGGGQTAAGPNGDFVEIFNRSCVAVNLDAYSIQIAGSQSGTTWNVVPLPNFQLDPGRYYCLRLFSSLTGTPYQEDQLQVGLPGTISGDLMLAGSGKAAIVIGDTPLPLADCPTSPNLVDLVKYQSATSPCTEGNTIAGALGSGRCVSRRPDVNGDGVGDGCQDTDNNSADFMIDPDACVPRTHNSGVTNNCPGAQVFGGCNIETGACIVTANAAACAAFGGNYLGDCTPCVAPQACCLPTTPVSCVVLSEVECQLDGGVFNPGNFTCPPSPGCGALGRCCAPDGNCITTFESLCVAPNVYGGDGTNCNGTPCQGRCCDLNGSCFMTGPDGCVTPNVFGGLGTDCSQPEVCQGRCCAPDGSCTLTGAANCFAPSTFGGVGSNCQNQRTYGDPNPPTVVIPTGAPGTTAGPSVPSIITVSDNFNIQDVDVVIKIQHTFRGDLNICLTGPDGTVVQLTAGTCTGGGTCGGEDNFNVRFDDESLAIVCANPDLANLAATPVGVIPAASLAVFDGLPSAGQWTLNINDDAGGDVGVLQEWAVLLDDGNACMGACCRTNGSCFISGELPCQQQGGTFQGAGVGCSPSPCAPNGACCIGGLCSQQSNIDCVANNGVFGGAGTSCDTPPCFVPCCKSDGTCTLLTAAACAALPFSTAGAPGTACPSEPCAPVGACCSEGDICEAPLVQAACVAPATWLPGVNCQLTYVTNIDCQPNFVDISTTGTELTGFATLDDSAVIVNLPFTFRYYGVDQTVASVGINGWLLFGGGSAAGIPGNSPLSGAGFANNAIYVYGDDLHLRSLSEGKIYVQQLGTSPDSLFIIQWHNVDIFDPSQPNGQRNTFQVKLYEASGVIEMQYLSLNLTSQTPLPADIVIGTRETASNVTEVSQSVVGVGPAAIIFAPTGGCTAITAPTGSCCIAGQPCSVQSQAQCQLLCGTYLGNNTNCSTTPCANEACCLPLGGCVDVVAAACASLNGVAQGPGTNCGTSNCPPAGKCCLANGACSVGLESTCNAPGSSWTAGADCSTPCELGACCQVDSSCTVTTAAGCSGCYSGNGTTCEFTLSENFDGVSVPNLPAGWTATNAAGASPPWATSDTGTPAPSADTAPNAAFVNDPAVVTDRFLDSPSITMPSGSVLTFRNNWLLENTFDGGVLEIDINGGGFTDIITAGGSFNSGGYNGTISVNFQSPILGRQAWTGTSNGFVTTSVNLPPAADGQSVVLRWRMATDISVSGTGWRVDTIALGQSICPANSPCTGGCPCKGDLNGDTVVNGKDVNLFAQCVASGGVGCPCGDMNNSSSANSADVAAFVTAVVTGNCGP